MNVHLQIDELILHGFTPADRQRIGAAVEAELTRLLVEQGVPSTLVNGGVLTRLDGGSFSVTATAKPHQIGRQVAQAIYQGLGQ